LHDVRSDAKKSSFDAEAELMQVVSEGALFSFFNDGSYTYISGKGNYVTGKWNVEKGENYLSLIAPGGSKEKLEFSVSSKPGQPVELVLKNGETGTQQKYTRDAEPVGQAFDDPYYPSNNTWRLKPAAPESKEQIKERLANYFKHFALILKAAKERKQDVVYFGLSKGPIHVYNGAIGILQLGEVPETWKKTYYNEADAETAYHLFEKALQQSSYQGGSVGDWVEDDYKILQTLYHGIKQMD